MPEEYLNKYLSNIEAMTLMRPCYYQVKGKTYCSNIKRLKVELEPNFGIKMTAYLDNGTSVIIHNAKAPCFIGQVPWGFLSRAECEEYWDM